MIAGGAIVSYNGDFGFMGLLIVKPEYRGKGIGRHLWYKRRDTLLSRLKNGASIGMDGVVEMQPFYRKGGFEIAFRDERYKRKGAEFPMHASVSMISKQDYKKVLTYDLQRFRFPREKFLLAWLELPGSHNFKFLKQDKIRGYASMQKVEHGYKIGPMFAEEASVAEELYKSCLNAADYDPVFLDIPLSNDDAVKLIEQYNAEYVFECARIYYGKTPAIDMKKVYGISSFELG